MAVDLGDLVEFLRNKVDPPGSDGFANATDDDFILSLQNAFWDARLMDMFSEWTEVDGSVTPIDVSTGDMPRDLQQGIILFAALNIVGTELKRLSTLFRAKAGPVEFEAQNSAQLLRDLYKDLVYQRGLVLRRLSDLGFSVDKYVDLIVGRNDSLVYGDTFWVTGGYSGSFSYDEDF